MTITFAIADAADKQGDRPHPGDTAAKAIFAVASAPSASLGRLTSTSSGFSG